MATTALRTRQTWRVQRLGVVDYGEAWDLQGRLVEQRQKGNIPDTLLLLQHPPTYTFGRRALPEHLLFSEEELVRRGIATHWVDRGGDVTYHGPGQIVGYPIVAIRDRGLDVHTYLRALEEVLIRTLANFGIEAERDSSYTGVWVRPPCHSEPFAALKGKLREESRRGDRAKIAAIGVKISRGVTCHGFALNVNTDLSYFEGIVPCGIPDRPVTSVQAVLGREIDLASVEEAIEEKFGEVFGLGPRRAQ